MAKNIGFVSTRFAGTDGVTLEASKWAQVLKNAGHNYFWFAGLLDRSPERSFPVPEAFFQHEKNIWIDRQIFGKKRRDPAVTDAIHELKTLLKKRLGEFVRTFN
ncbi:glycosyltransferase family 1 protein, partial [bacterium]|nr:glycosyltransferase family 1 protein [bacterium]